MAPPSSALGRGVAAFAAGTIASGVGAEGALAPRAMLGAKFGAAGALGKTSLSSGAKGVGESVGAGVGAGDCGTGLREATIASAAWRTMSVPWPASLRGFASLNLCGSHPVTWFTLLISPHRW